MNIINTSFTCEGQTGGMRNIKYIVSEKEYKEEEQYIYWAKYSVSN